MTEIIDSKKPFLQVLHKQPVNTVPFWFMRQAGRYLPEYRALRADKGGFLDMAYDPNAASEITMQPIRRFSMDAAIIFSDILTIPHALGQNLSFVQGEGPKLGDLDIKSLSRRHFDETLQPVYDAISKTREMLEGEGYDQTALIGFCGAPWTVVTYMVEGGGSKMFDKVKTLAYKDPETFGRLIDIITDASADYLIKQVDAGAEALQIFDSWAGVLDAHQFVKWSIQPTAKLIKKVKDVHPAIKIIGFPKGAGTNYLKYARDTGVDCIQIDSNVPTDWARSTLQTLMPVQGNLDPFCLKAGGAALEFAAEKILNDLAGGDFIFNLGHGINKDTPIDHVERLCEILKNYRK